MMRKRMILLFFVFLPVHFGLYAQSLETEIKTSAAIDTNNLLIGDQLHYIIKAKAPAGTNIVFPAIKDSIGKIEFLETYKTDTLAKNGDVSLRKTYLITSFDEGTHIIPQLPVLAQGGANGFDTVFTNPVAIRFLPVKVDTAKPYKDIKPVMEEPVGFWEYFRYVIYILLAAALIYAGIKIWKKYRKKEEAITDYDPSIPPHILAKEALLQLENEKLWQKGQLKLYHSRLSDILRTYIERRYGFPAMEMTTSEIIPELNGLNLDSQLVLDLNKILELADLVKFAKYHPLPDENASSMTLAKNFVDATTAVAAESPNKKEADDVQ